MAETNRGWFRVPGIRDAGDRTLAEQMMGLDQALKECAGKTVLDLGCAEGLIALEFAKAGAASVHGIELLETHLQVARKVCKGFPVRFTRVHLDDYVKANPKPEQYDIVLALGIIHKLPDPVVPLRFAAGSSKDLVLFRAPAVSTQGIVQSKFTTKQCDVPRRMTKYGFFDEGIIKGVRGESVQYWRRVK